MRAIEVETTEATEAADVEPVATWPGRLLAGGGLAASIVAHLAIGGAALFAGPKLLATASQQAIAIDIVSPQEFEQASKGSPADAASEAMPDKAPAFELPTPGEQPSSPPAQPALAQTAQPQSQAQSQPSPQPASQPLPQPWSLPSPLSPTPNLPDQHPPDAVRPPNDAAQPGPAAPNLATMPSPAEMADLLHLPLAMSNSGPDGMPTESGAKLSADEIADFKGHLRKCWTPPAGVPEVNKLKAVVRVAFAPDGRLQARPSLLAASASIYGPALVESVMKALARCQPYNMLPPEKYAEWKLLDLNFSQDDLFDVNPASSTGSRGPKG